jgi:hypothetical protein
MAVRGGSIGELYTQFTEKNKEKLMKTAKPLLKVQKEDAGMLADAPPVKAGKEGLA